MACCKAEKETPVGKEAGNLNPKPLKGSATETFVEARFQEWDPEEALGMERAGTGWTGLIAAPTKAGKTHLTTYLLSRIGHWFDEIVLVSPTRKISGDFPCFNDKNVMKEFDLTKVQSKFEEWKRVNERIKDKKRRKRYMFIFDDVISHAPDIHRSPTLMEIATLGRHFGVSQVLLLQSVSRFILNPAFRANLEFLAVSFLKKAADRKTIFDEYMGIVERKEAERVYTELTRRKYGFAVLQHNPHARELEEVMFKFTVPSNLGKFSLRPKCVEFLSGGAIPAHGSLENYVKRPKKSERRVETGYLYIMTSPVFTEVYGDLYKVGRASSIENRMKSYRTGLPGAAAVWSAMYQDIAEIEKRVQERLHEHNWKVIRNREGKREVSGASEWYMLDYDSIRAIIADVEGEVARDRRRTVSVVRRTRQGVVRREVSDAELLEGTESGLESTRLIRSTSRSQKMRDQVNRQVAAILAKKGIATKR